MVITYQGENYFKIQSGSTIILIDPPNARSFKGASLILNTTNPPLTKRETVGNESFWIENQGEYEIGGVRVDGWTIDHDDKEHTSYLFKLEDVTIGVLGYINKEPSLKILEQLQGTDILIIPGSGKPFISETAAAKLIKQIEPGIVIPSQLTKLPKKFATELNQTLKPEPKLVLKRKNIPEGKMEIRYLKS